MNKYLPHLLLLFFLFASCGTPMVFLFRVTNQLSENIKVVCNFGLGDSTHYLSPQQTKTLFKGGAISKPRSDYFKDGFFLIKKMDVYKSNDSLIEQNFSLREKWNLDWVSNDSAIYTLNIK